VTTKPPTRNSDRLAGFLLNLLLSAFFVSCLLTAWFAASGDPAGIDGEQAMFLLDEGARHALGMIEYMLTYPGIYLLGCLGMAFVLTAAGVGVSFMTWLREE
jgi:hypothetical protein